MSIIKRKTIVLMLCFSDIYFCSPCAPDVGKVVVHWGKLRHSRKSFSCLFDDQRLVEHHCNQPEQHPQSLTDSENVHSHVVTQDTLLQMLTIISQGNKTFSKLCLQIGKKTELI